MAGETTPGSQCVRGYPAIGGEGNKRRNEVAPGNIPASSFYVYKLIDPRDNRAFYIGKGKGRRAWLHEQEALREPNGYHVNMAKTEKIQSIIAVGLHVQIEIDSVWEAEKDALTREANLILSHHNITNVKCGLTGSKETAEQHANRFAKLRIRRRQRRLLTFPNA